MSPNRFVSRLLGGRRAGPPRVGYLVYGGGGRHPATAHIRVVGPLTRAAAAGRISATQIDQVRFAHGGDPAEYDVVLVQRDVVEPDHVDAFLAECARRRVRLVFEADDDFVTGPARERLLQHGYFSTKLDALRQVVGAADAVIVSTDELAATMAPFGAPVTVAPNALDPALWGADADGGSVGSAIDSAREFVSDDGEFRMLYAGTATHAGDLALLRETVQTLRDETGGRVVLETIGVTGEDGDWYRRLPVPDHAVNLPDFVRWLRSMSGRWSLGLAPLADEDFNRSKSDLKFLEYSMLGLPVVASAVEPYRGIPAHGGIGVANTAEAWGDAIRSVLAESSANAERAATARRYVESERFEPVGERWLKAVTARRGR
ncbi:glycosyltransferase family protein [Herbiconiux ginsengi]|uniref:Glycosyltransferase involved in cell wall bisynthesis n=1 Tax=Herbiconiux ginsengi TaxID=381665 RepID=A0A1H3SUS4_9MICO|nr:glycosyltransferase [Herbiconiux ginsengi]SDZ41281.1 Glycosyltransferase involved in cell wall bisynthesis [Herbiconiux ginsengi]